MKKQNNKLSYFTDLQGSQTIMATMLSRSSLVTLLIYKVLKRSSSDANAMIRLVTLLIYKVLKHRQGTLPLKRA